MRILSYISAAFIILHAATMQGENNLLHLGRDCGLSNNYIMSIAQDHNGFVWVSTESGLNRFDGTRFTPIKSEEGSLAADELNRIAFDPESNTLYICTQRNGLDALDCDSYIFTHYNDSSHRGNLASNGITDIAPASNGIVWVATYTSGLDRLDTKNGKSTHFNSQTVKGWCDNKLWTVKLSSDGKKIYLGHVDGGFSIFIPGEKRFKNYKHTPTDPTSLPGNNVRDILVDPIGNVWIGTDKGLALFNPEKGNFTVFRHNPSEPGSLVSDVIHHLSRTSDGRLWISTENGGLSVLNINDTFLQSPADIKFTNYTTGTPETFRLSNKTIKCTFEDHYGNIWIGTAGDGLDIISYRPSPIRRRHSSSLHNRLSDNSVMSMGIYGDSLFVGTDSKGLDIFVNGNYAENVNSDNSPLGDNAVLSLAKSKKGEIWMGTYGGNVVVRKKNGAFLKIEIPGSIDVRDFAETADGFMIIATGRGPAVVSGTGEIKTLWNNDGHNTDEWLRTLLVRNNGEIWIGSFGSGIAIYDSHFRLKRRLNVNNHLYSNTINHLVEYNGDVWAATGKGLVRLDRQGNVTRIFTREDGLSDNVVMSLTVDTSKRLWIATGNGLCVIDSSGKINSYHTGYGLSRADFYGASAATDSDGNIYFGSHNGLYSFNPDILSMKVSIPSPHITGISIYGNKRGSVDHEYYTMPSDLTLKHSQNTMLVRFGLTDAAVAQSVEWSYRLEGLNDRWIPTAAEPGILLSNLPAGSYRLIIKAFIPNQKEESTIEMPFRVNPPFWASIWAYMLYAIVLATIIILGMRFYRKRLELEYFLSLEKDKRSREHEMVAERMRFFTNITHELRTPLTLIIGPIDDLTNDPSLPTPQRRKMSIIYNSATRLLDLINTILEFRKTETGNRELAVEYADISSLVADIGMRYDVLNTNPLLHINIDIAPGDYKLWFDKETMNIIIDNLMSNACKYTTEGSVTIKLSKSSEGDVPFTEISVRDTGLGISQESLPHIFDRYYRDSKSSNRLGTGIGLALVYNLVKLHEGEIFVESVQGEGSVFTVRLQSLNTYPHANKQETGLNTINEAQDIHDSPTEERGEKPRVLIVDDNIDILNYISECLGNEYSVSTATDGNKGLQKALSIIPDIIITDLMMPNMDGITFIKCLKNHTETSFIPVLIITAKVSEDARTEAYDCGADSFITKPFSSKLLRSRLRNIIQQRQLSARYALEEKFGHKNDKPDSTYSPMTDAMTQADREFIERISNLINNNIGNGKLDVKNIADAMAMSHSTLYRKIKTITGLSIAALIRKCRAHKAAELLKSGKYTVSEVAMIVGLENIGNFRQCLREEFNINHSDFIRKVSQGNKQ